MSYTLISFRQITLFLLGNAIISSFTNPCSSNVDKTMSTDLSLIRNLLEVYNKNLQFCDFVITTF